MTGRYRLTFNKPAVVQLLQTANGEEADGIKVRLEDGKLSFLPVCDSDENDVLLLEHRSRGGMEAMVEGTLSKELIAALSHDAGPFSVLTRRAGGWIVPVPHPEEQAPPKFVPHVRVWDNIVVEKAAPKAKKADKTNGSLHHMIDELHQARQVVAAFDLKAPRRGATPKKVREARALLTSFEGMVADLLPEIGAARMMLGKLTGDNAH